MPRVNKAERYVKVVYELQCGYMRAEALAKDLCRNLRGESGLDSAKDDTRGWDGDRRAVVVVVYRTLQDANRLDARVRELLGRKVDFTYKPHVYSTYGSRGPSSYVTATTSIAERVAQT